MITIHHQQFKYTHNTLGHYLTGVYLFSIGPTLSITAPIQVNGKHSQMLSRLAKYSWQKKRKWDRQEPSVRIQATSSVSKQRYLTTNMFTRIQMFLLLDGMQQ